VKRALYDAGYPVEDDRDLDVGDPVDVDLTTDLRSYQETWVETFLDARSGCTSARPGSGKTVAAIATIAAIGGETLILVPPANSPASGARNCSNTRRSTRPTSGCTTAGKGDPTGDDRDLPDRRDGPPPGPVRLPEVGVDLFRRGSSYHGAGVF